MTTPYVRLRATILPEGRDTDLWVREGLLRLEGPADSPWLCPPGGFILSGLVDAHCHLSWPHERGSLSHTFRFMNAQRRVHAEIGVTLLRDMGSDRDDILRLPDEPGLPSVQGSGQVILRDDQWPLTNTPPDRLKATMLERVRRGARWVKVFADFSSDFQGRDNPAFSGSDELTYSLDQLADAVSAVHALGARVASHCYSRAGAEVSIEAGIDSLEHGWGLDEALLDRMAVRRIAWIPLAGIASSMREIARKHENAENLRWIEDRMTALTRLLPLAHARGIGVYAGSDWFPNPTVVDEIGALAALGFPREAAVAAGSWAARRWLGFPGIEDGVAADLVVYDEDPRATLETLYRPRAIMLGGKTVQPNPKHFPRHGSAATGARKSSPPRPIHRTNESDRYFDYCLQPYEPRRSAVGKIRAENLLWCSIDHAGLSASLEPPLRAIQRRCGQDMTVFGVKHEADRLFWELYFYDPQKEEERVTATSVIETLAPYFSVNGRVDEAMPYFMASFDLDEETVATGRVDGFNLYLAARQAQAGRSYKVVGDRLEFENIYRFLHPKQEIDRILQGLRSSVFVDFSRIKLSQVLMPELFSCRRICVAKKRRADAIYYSGIDVERLIWFLKRFRYPEELIRFTELHRHELDHLLFDVGIDYACDSDGRLTMNKTSFYGTL